MSQMQSFCNIRITQQGLSCLSMRCCLSIALAGFCLVLQASFSCKPAAANSGLQGRGDRGQVSYALIWYCCQVLICTLIAFTSFTFVTCACFALRRYPVCLIGKLCSPMGYMPRPCLSAPTLCPLLHTTCSCEITYGHAMCVM